MYRCTVKFVCTVRYFVQLELELELELDKVQHGTTTPTT
jgi:hypothetical protein